MAHVGKSGSYQQMDHLAHARQAHPPARAQHRQAQHTGAREHIAMVPTASIDGQAGVRQGVQPRAVNLAHYAAVATRLSGQRYVARRQAQNDTRADRKALDDEEAAFQDAVHDALTLLGEDSGRRSREELESQLERHFEPVRQLKVLVQTLQTLESEDLPGRQKTGISRALNAMITGLMKKHPHEIRAVLQETEEAGAVKSDQVSEELQSSARLRLLIGAKDMGRFDTPLSPLTVLKALIRNFGPDCLLGMHSLRTRMMSGL